MLAAALWVDMEQVFYKHLQGQETRRNQVRVTGWKGVGPDKPHLPWSPVSAGRVTRSLLSHDPSTLTRG